MTTAFRSAAAGENSPAAAAHAGTALRLSGLNKTFGSVQVLFDAGITVRPGTVHALLGGNGSGKSTTIKILAGIYPADSGELEVFGERYPLSGYLPTTAERIGLRFVHQDLGLFEDLTVEENFALDAGYPRTVIGGIDWRALHRRVAGLLADYEIDARPDTPVNQLRPSDRTLVAIARALQDDEGGRLIAVLDEPTASLGKRESEELLSQVRRRADLGQTFIIVSHRLQEVLSVAQDFTVFRDGRVVGTLVDAHPSEDEIVGIMAGGAVAALKPTGTIGHATAEPVLEIEHLRVGPLEDVSLTVHSGEIVGLAGLAGSGRSTLLETVFGAIRPDSGIARLGGTPYAPHHVDEAMGAGVALVPGDRLRQAAFAELSTAENIGMSVLKESWRRGFTSRSGLRRAAAGLIHRFGVKVAGPDAAFVSMSGGNQQKAVLARWLQRKPRLILLDEPTQGVDVMSRADIYAVVRDTARDGSAVLIASSDLSELHALCDRVLVLAGGRITHDVAASELDVDQLTALVLKEPQKDSQR
ncbi:MAG: sugar ABC transporter ATP-binding protein [Microbacteriaceae bacterium]